MLNCVLVASVFVLTALCSKSPSESRKIAKDICKNRCACEERENVLNINCEKKGFTKVSWLQPPHNRIYQLFLNGNSLSKLPPNGFINFTNTITLHLGSNGLQDIRNGAFHGLATLKSLHLNNNRLEVLREDTFLGLESLEYLQADYNYITSIEAGTFSKLNKLKVLILNDNLLPVLPNNVFRFVLLTHLDLRGNRFKKLPFTGVLEHIGGIMEIQLEENPWNCTCDLVPLKGWLDTISYLVNDMVCETPFRLHGKDVIQLNKQDICPRKTAGDSGLRIERPPKVAPHLPSTVSSSLTPANPTPRGAKPGRHSKSRTRPTPAPNPRQIFGPIMVYQTRSPIQTICPNICSCSVQNSDNTLNVHCQERRIRNITDLHPKPSSPKKLYLTGNLLHIVQLNDLRDYRGLELLHLGNNRISVIQEGAFRNLSHLRRLYLNGNHIERLSPALFGGLQRLQYLYLESNVIKEILQYTFHSLARLSLLYLNNNLLRSLPSNVFVGTNLTRLNLRNNHFSQLPVRGVLDQLPAAVQIDLQENPWDCACSIVALKSWIEQSRAGVVISEVSCESPAKYAGRALSSLRNQEICSEYTDLAAASPPAITHSSSLLDGDPGTLGPEVPRASAVPLSVLILGLLVVFILSVCFGAGLFVFVLKRRKTGQSGRSSSSGGGGGGNNNSNSNSGGGGGVVPNNLDLNSYQLQYGPHGSEPGEKAEAHVYNYITHPVGQMCKNPIYVQREGERVAFYRDLQDLSCGGLGLKKAGQLAARAYSISTVELLQQQPPLLARHPELLYQNLAERAKVLPGGADAHYSFCTLPKRPFAPSHEARHKDQDRLNKTVLYGTPRKQSREPPRSDNPSLQGQEPDYLEVLEKQTVISQL
ncbi:SLIT and NTRK-like protein 2 [Carcharodon carcharias]|uniref:SLIT and NTRK-like protein 2 n=1 Tax=Carcharodon carcharias TaxID=13397 RepID=UPI001B7F0672|nr:SLIT and NTRK-like protein 2 [Carcharodon carcharias]